MLALTGAASPCGRLLTSVFLVWLTAGVAWNSQISEINVVELGARRNRTDSAATTEAFRSALANSSARIRVPPGNYLIDNSKGPLTAINFGGEFSFASGAKLWFTDNTRAGLLFVGGTGANITGLRADYVSPPTVRRSPHEQLKFSDTINTLLTDTIVEHSPAAGILFYNCVRPRVQHAVVMHSLADGLHFANCQDAEVTDLNTADTGDDGLAFLNYAKYPDKIGGTASNIHVRQSQARGITVVGQSNIVISNFTVETTAASGLLCARDYSYDTRIPSNVLFTDGQVTNAGVLGPVTANRYGIEFNDQVDCEFSNIQVIRPASNGVAGKAQAGRVKVDHVEVDDVQSGSGFQFYQTKDVILSNLISRRTPGYGFLFQSSAHVTAQHMTAVDASQASDLKRAIWFENGQTVAADDILIESTAANAGRILGAYQKPGIQQSGEIRGVHTADWQKAIPIESNCPELKIIR